MQESRLFKILYHLLDKGAATAPELAKKFEVSTRTVYRDIEALSGAGVPVYMEPGRNGGIRLLSGFVLNKAVISEQEKEKIISALQGLAVLSDGSETETLEKLSALFQVDTVDWLEVDFSRWGNKPRDNKKFEILKKAVIYHRCVKITYVGSYKTVSERIIEPLKLFYKAKDWYIKAYCRQRQDFRLFKLSRILEWEYLEENFVPMTFPEMKDVNQSVGNEIVLCFPKTIAYRVYDEFDINQIQVKENGDFVVTADMPEDDWLIGYLLSFGGQVKIIQPEYLKAILAAKAKEIYEKNMT